MAFSKVFPLGMPSKTVEGSKMQEGSAKQLRNPESQRPDAGEVEGNLTPETFG